MLTRPQLDQLIAQLRADDSPTAGNLAAVANVLGVPSISLLTIDDADDDDQPGATAPKVSDVARQTQRSALASSGVQATPPQIAVEEERRQMLLEQAKGRGGG